MKYTYRCTGLVVDGSTHITDLTGFEAEYLADSWMRRCIEGDRYVLARITILSDKGSVLDVRRQYVRSEA